MARTRAPQRRKCNTCPQKSFLARFFQPPVCFQGSLLHYPGRRKPSRDRSHHPKKGMHGHSGSVLVYVVNVVYVVYVVVYMVFMVYTCVYIYIYLLYMVYMCIFVPWISVLE